MQMTYQQWTDAGHSPFDWRNAEGLTLADLIAAGRDPEEEKSPEDSCDHDEAATCSTCEAGGPA